MTTKTDKAQEEEWQTEEDARTMIRMAEIMKDEKRHERAQAKMDDMSKMAEMMKNIGMNYKSMGEMKK